MQLQVYDPEVHLSSLLGANRRYIESHLPHIGNLLVPEIDKVIAGSDVLVVGSGSGGLSTAITARQAGLEVIAAAMATLSEQYPVELAQAVQHTHDSREVYKEPPPLPDRNWQVPDEDGEVG